jgi:hypothetical protein
MIIRGAATTPCILGTVQHHELSPWACALAGGCTAAIVSFFLACTAIVAGTFGSTLISIIADIAPGYASSVSGAVIGGFWLFLWGSGIGYVFAWLYNTFVRSLHP